MKVLAFIAIAFLFIFFYIPLDYCNLINNLLNNISMKQTVKQLATKDIQDALRQEGKCFIAFRSNLNSTIGHIVRAYINKQKNL